MALKEQIGSRLGNYYQKINKSPRKDFRENQKEFNKVVSECLRIIAETIDNKCVILSKNDFKDSNLSEHI